MFKSLQILRTARALRTSKEPRVNVPAGTRVTVIKTAEDGKVLVRTAEKLRITASQENFVTTRRGRQTLGEVTK